MAVALLCLLSCKGQQRQDIKETRFLLGTIVEFTVFSDNETQALQAISQAAEVMQGVENKFTTHGEVSNTVQNFNRAKAGEKVQLDVEVERLLLQAIAIHAQTSGSFDPTLGELNSLWGFSSENKPSKPLSRESIAKCLSRSGTHNIQQLGPQQWLKSSDDLQLDFGAIAKGLAIDKGVASLAKSGVKHAIINAGGDMRILGDHGGKPWKVAVRHPRLNSPLGWFEVERDMSIVTSGDYERFFFYQGRRYHHVLDPQTGLPATSSMSVTVTAPTAEQADALSTAMFVLGYEKGKAVIEAIPDVEAIWVDENQNLSMSSGLAETFNIYATNNQASH